jgi:hypothetical protein
MTNTMTFTFRGLGRSVTAGLKMGILTALFYSLAFAIVAIPRASAQIFSSLTLSEGLLPTLLANAADIYLLSIEFAFGMGLIAALVCALTFAVIYLLVLVFKAQTARPRMWIGAGVSLVLAVILHLLLWPLEGIPHAMLFRSVGGYLFWLGAPCLIYIVLTAWISARSFPHKEVNKKPRKEN